MKRINRLHLVSLLYSRKMEKSMEHLLKKYEATKKQMMIIQITFKHPTNQATWELLQKKYQRVHGRTISKDYKYLLISLEDIVGGDLSLTQRKHYSKLLNTLPTLQAKNQLKVIMSGLIATQTTQISKEVRECLKF